MDTLHKSIYDISKAISALVPQGGPVLCRDEMEEWSASEANLFEEALEKYGKDFTDIQQDFVSAIGKLIPSPGGLLETPLGSCKHILWPGSFNLFCPGMVWSLCTEQTL
jgi:hypothetical protein